MALIEDFILFLRLVTQKMKKLHSGSVCFQAVLCYQVQKWLSHRSLSTHCIDKDHTCGDKAEAHTKYALTGI